MRATLKTLAALLITFAFLLLLHLPFLRLPYFWDEAGYYIPAALDFYRYKLLIPVSTLPSGHTPLVMIYLCLAWSIWTYSALTTRAAMTLIAASTILSTFALGRRVAGREVALWSSLLLALSPLFFAQSTLAHLDLAAALFTVLAVLFLLHDKFWLFAVAASLAVLSKETAVVLLPVAWFHVWRRGRSSAGQPVCFQSWCALVTPTLPLAAWALYYHHATGYWIGNREYLSYNVYSTLSSARIFWSLLRRTYELFVGGFSWVLTISAVWGFWWSRRAKSRTAGFKTRETNAPASFEPRVAPAHSSAARDESVFHQPRRPQAAPWGSFLALAVGLIVIYLILLSVVGGAILPRYLLPAEPMYFLAATALVHRLPRTLARLIVAAAAACLVSSWYTNPPYPFPYEDNLSYADFIHLHGQAAQFLESQSGRPRILTAWPATDELTKPFLGYVRNPLRVVPVQGFAPDQLAEARGSSFDLLYFYSRKWEPPGNWTARFPAWLRVQARYFDYRPQAEPQVLARTYHVRLLAEFKLRGQWVRIYANTSTMAKSGSGSLPVELPPLQSAPK
jgi:4-amino-4-deoxy-L-arabinose transferase-like glycosyltransferase